MAGLPDPPTKQERKGADREYGVGFEFGGADCADGSQRQLSGQGPPPSVGGENRAAIGAERTAQDLGWVALSKIHRVPPLERRRRPGGRSQHSLFSRECRRIE